MNVCCNNYKEKLMMVFFKNNILPSANKDARSGHFDDRIINGSRIKPCFPMAIMFCFQF